MVKTEQLIAVKVVEFLESSKCYLDADLRLDYVCYSLGTNRTYASRAIKTIAPSFNALINGYRIRHAIGILKEHPFMPFETLSSQSGFNNRRTFYQAFKLETGKTPSDFRHSMFENGILAGK